jgi:hypothetical protein
VKPSFVDAGHGLVSAILRHADAERLPERAEERVFKEHAQFNPWIMAETRITSP